jgi:dolichyl-phosphate beta-glucosyltransferase
VSLVLPAYNPGREIDNTWRQIESFLNTDTGRWEIIFVCDGCSDGSAARLEALASEETERVRVLSYDGNRGKGYAVRHGLAAARGDFRIFTDIDLAYSWDDVRAVADALRSGASMVVGSRQHPDSTMTMAPGLQGYLYRRHWQSQAFVTLAQRLLPIAQADPQAGLKGMTAGVAQLVLPALDCDGFCFDCELLTACTHFGVPVHEVPVHVRYRDRASTTGIAAVRRMVGDLWRIRSKWRRMPQVSFQRVETGVARAA